MSVMSDRVDWKRIAIYLAFAFGIAWITGLVIYLTGGLANSMRLGPSLTLAAVLLPTGYMFAPALANIFTRLVTREGFGNAGLRPYFRRGWPYWLAAWVLPAVLTILGAVVFFLIFPQYYAGTSILQAQQEARGNPFPSNLWGLALTQLLLAILISPIVNGFFTFGEEFGWRAYMLPKLMPLGPRVAMIVQGAIWGVWHWPVIIMGYEYGFGYFGFPWVGMLLFLLFTFSGGVFLAWVTLKGRSVWPAVIGHAAINGIAGIAILFTRGQPPHLLGPLPVGLVGMLGYLTLALILFFLPMALTPATPSSLPYPWKEPESAEGVNIYPQ